MKSNFIPKFIAVLQEVAGGLDSIFSRESLYYKDLRRGGHDPNKIYNGFKNLKNRGLIQDISDDRYRFTSEGRQWLRANFLKYVKIKNKKWDKKWRVVIFDIPQELHRERGFFRRKLKMLGFTMIQKSIFVFPYPCEEELGYICNDLGVTDYVDMIIAEKITGRDGELKKQFRL